MITPISVIRFSRGFTPVVSTSTKASGSAGEKSIWRRWQRMLLLSNDRSMRSSQRASRPARRRGRPMSRTEKMGTFRCARIAPCNDAESPDLCRRDGDRGGHALPSGRRRLVFEGISRTHESAGAGVAGDQGGSPCPRRGADRIGQDARRFPCGDRRSRAPGRRGRAARRNVGRLCLAVEGAVQRHPAQPRSTARGNPRRARGSGLSGRRNPHAGPNRRYAAKRAREHAPPPAANRRHDSRVAVRAAGLGVRPQDALDDADGDRRRDPRARPEQAGQPSLRCRWSASPR